MHDGSSNSSSIIKGDLIALNENSISKITPNIDSHAFILRFPSQFCEDKIKDFDETIFTIHPQENKAQFKNYYRRARQFFSQLILLWSGHNTNSLEYDREILNFLMVNLKYFSHKEIIQTKNKSIDAIIQYINQNYQNNINLSDLAKRFYVSPTYLSRSFTRHTGIGFHDYLMNIRIKAAEIDLIQTDLTIDAIAFHNGFLSSRTFSRAFSKATALTPTKYRKQSARQQEVSGSIDKTIIDQPSTTILELLQSYLDESNPHDLSINFYNSESQSYFVDTSEPVSDLPAYRFQLPEIIITIGDPLNILRSDVRKQLQIIQSDIGNITVQLQLDPPPFRYQTDHRVATVNIPFEIWDEIISYFYQEHIGLIIRIDEKQFATDSSPFKIFCEHFSSKSHEYSTFARSWRFLLSQTSAYTIGTLNTFSDFIDLFSHYFSDASLLGLGLVDVSNEIYTKNLLAKIIQSNISIGFIDYNMNQNDYLNDRTSYAVEDIRDNDLIILTRIKQELALNCPLYLSNWNTLTGQSRHTNGYFFRGAIIAKTIIDHINKVTAIGFWLNTELLENKVADNMTATGISLFYYHYGRRPAFHVLALLSRLSKKIVFSNPYLLVTQQEANYQVLFLNPIIFDPRLSTQELLLKQQEKLINITLKSISAGKYKIKKRTFDMNHGALYFIREQLRTESGFDEETMQYVVQRSVPDLLVYETSVTNSLSISNYMLYNALILYEIQAE